MDAPFEFALVSFFGEGSDGMCAEFCSHDCPKVDEKGLAEIEKFVRNAGVNLEGEGELGGWVGGRVVLVPTDKPIKEWAPIAEREL